MVQEIAYRNRLSPGDFRRIDLLSLYDYHDGSAALELEWKINRRLDAQFYGAAGLKQYKLRDLRTLRYAETEIGASFTKEFRLFGGYRHELEWTNEWRKRNYHSSRVASLSFLDEEDFEDLSEEVDEFVERRSNSDRLSALSFRSYEQWTASIGFKYEFEKRRRRRRR